MLPTGVRLAVARGTATRLRGLAGLDALGPNHALHLPACRSVHTFGIRFALDLIWLDGRGVPVRVDRAVAPRRLAVCLAARSVVECPAGSAQLIVSALVPPALTSSSPGSSSAAGCPS